MSHIWLPILCGSLVGFALGLVGGGGSMLATPLLLYVVGIAQPHVAIGTGAVSVSVAAFSNFATHAVAGHVRWRNAFVFAAVGTLGAIIGSSLGKAFDGQKLLMLFALLMVVVGVLMLRSRDSLVATPYEKRTDATVAGLALFAGMASGFFGIGGGFLIVPCLLYATRMPMIDAVGSSLLAVTAFGVATAANYARSGLVDWPIATWFVLGGLAGGLVGMRAAIKLCEQKDRLRRIFSIMIFVVAGYMLYRSLGAMMA